MFCGTPLFFRCGVKAVENFIPLAEPLEAEDLQADYETAMDFDKAAIGADVIYFNRFARVEYLPISDIQRAYLQVGGLNPQQCCNTSFDVFTLAVIYADDKMAECRVSYESLGREILAELANRNPNIIFEPK